eukprot:513053-Pleurochrysis_carterae.AAC.1
MRLLIVPLVAPIFGGVFDHVSTQVSAQSEMLRELVSGLSMCAPLALSSVDKTAGSDWRRAVALRSLVVCVLR